ncbi:MAG: ribonuclease J [Patescibacteria group bacterium]|nr:ribonuclease J [Patescibacteria group bacterium]MDD4304008.1 ribonuclease J [Patescibacteria group bacterium]MDD4695003.1 ribonuclease J [Patescibacteria group bacterium]
MNAKNKQINKRIKLNPHNTDKKNISDPASEHADSGKFSEKEKLKVIVLGGNEEVGRNMTILEYENDIIIIDMGVSFPEEDMPGIDLVIPNIEYLRGKQNKIRGVVVTHGHLDHIGAIPYLIPELGNPTIYSSPLALGIIQKRAEEFDTLAPLNLSAINSDDVLKLGVFTVTFFKVSHNIPDSMGIIVDTPLGKIVHSGDFKLDFDGAVEDIPEISKIARLGEQNILALMSDSTNAPKPGHQVSESEIKGNLFDIIRNVRGRVIIGTFSSLLNRVQQIILAAEKLNKKIIIEGYSMKTNVEIAHQLGYLKYKKDTIITEKQLREYPDNRIVVCCTGAQGEDRAVLMRIVNKEHKFLSIQKDDTVIFSSSVIPGNERAVQRLTDSLYRQGADVVHYQMMDVHAGGHGKKEDLKLMINLVKPKYFIPIEGHHSFLHMHAKIAEETGVDPKNIFIADNGQVIEFTKLGGRLTNKRVPSEYVFVDGLGVGDISNIVLRDRKQMAEDGMIVAIVTISAKTGELVHSPDIISRGFVYMKENKELIEKTRDTVRKLTATHNPKSMANDMYLKNKIRNELGKFLFEQTERRPMILPVVIEV